VARLRPGLPTAVLTTTPLHRPAEYVRRLVGAAAYHPSSWALGARSRAYRERPSAGTLQTRELAELRDAGVPVFAYTVDAGPRRGDLADHLAEAGVTGLFADAPGPLVRRWRGTC
jgi:glycerophosphoryl diester phosphodiesterase